MLKTHINDIISMYRNYDSVSSIAERYGVSRQAVYNVLKKHGIDTSTGSITIVCNECGKEFRLIL